VTQANKKRKDKFDTIHTLVPYMSNGYEYALSSGASTETRILVHCFLESLEEGKVDIDKFIELSNLQWDENDFLATKEYIITDDIIDIIRDCITRLSNIADNIDNCNLGCRVALITLSRLISTFQGTSVLIKFGFSYEIHCMLRVTLEQIAYAYQCSFENDESIIKKIQPQTCISKLKQLNEYANQYVGKMNGILSDFIHLNPKISSSFLQILDNQIKVGGRSGRQSKRTVIYFVALARLYVDVITKISKDCISGTDEELSFLFNRAQQIFNRSNEKLKNIHGQNPKFTA
jgi:hypothetical protein